jgi:Protein of unknown function (DUF1186)/SEC-C motif
VIPVLRLADASPAQKQGGTAMDTAETIETSSPVDLDRILAALSDVQDTLPEEAIREARQYRDLMVPRLIDVLRKAAADVRAGHARHDDTPFFALFLLGEFQAHEALPAILDVLSLPADGPSDLFGDAICSALPRILVSLGGKEAPAILDELIENAERDRFVRWDGATGYTYLVRDGSLSREVAVQRLAAHLRRAIDREDVDITGPLVCTLCDLYPRDAYEVIREAFNKEVVDEFESDLGSVDDSLRDGMEASVRHLEALDPTHIEDTIEELRTWAWFAPKDEPESASDASISGTSEPFAEEMAQLADEIARLTGATSLEDDLSDSNLISGPTPKLQSQRVGRNDPCPCGSGKKYKKCCGLEK